MRPVGWGEEVEEGNRNHSKIASYIPSIHCKSNKSHDMNCIIKFSDLSVYSQQWKQLWLPARYLCFRSDFIALAKCVYMLLGKLDYNVLHDHMCRDAALYE